MGGGYYNPNSIQPRRRTISMQGLQGWVLKNNDNLTFEIMIEIRNIWNGEDWNDEYLK